MVAAVLAEAAARSDIAVHVSIRLGAMIVFAADDAGMKWLIERLPGSRFPMKLDGRPRSTRPCSTISFRWRGCEPGCGFQQARFRRSMTRQALVPPLPSIRGNLQLHAQHRLTGPMISPVRCRLPRATSAPIDIVVLGPGTTLGAPSARR